MKKVHKDKIVQIRHGNVPEGYKKTRSGIVPMEWNEVCLGDIYTERKEPGNESLPMLMVSIHSGVSDGEVDEEDLPKKVKRIEDKSQYRRAAKGDLVFNMMRAWQGAIGTVRTEGMVSPAYIVAEPNDKVDPLFMDYFMKMKRIVQTIHRQSYGVTDFRLRLYWDSFAPIQCVLPSVLEQKKITEILTTQDKVIELKEKRLAEKQRQKKYLMHRFFDDTFCTNDANCCNVKIGDIGDFYGGLTGKSAEDFGVGKAKYITFKNVIGNTIIDTDILDVVSIIDGEEQNAVKKGDLFFNLSSETAEEVGMCAVLLSEVVDTYLNSFCTGFRLRVGNVDPLFLAYYFNGPIGRRIMFSLAQGVTRINLNKVALANHYICMPAYDHQIKVSRLLSVVDREIDLLRQRIEQEKQKKKALMQLLLTGVVRV